ncbi:MAG: HEAT repeat domain-containing protein, partial [Planctomycetes bacterium]|nr:HEAT repeat domain-containing protein [Planctomycetota bacterium]
QGLISHELCHQWTGDLITCKSWAHLWLNEGWATYGAALWFEHRDGEDGYLDAMRSNFRRVTARDKAGQGLPMVSPVYEHPRETFRRAANPYPKGASILHMLRRMLGDELFFQGVHLYMNRHALGVVETNDFRYAMEEVSGLGLEWFFEQWCYRPGVPELSVDVRYDGKSRELLVDIEQTQHIDEQAPAYRFTLPIFVRTAEGDRTFDIEVQEQQTSYRAVLDSPPTIVAVDPYLHVLKKITVQKPQAMWTTQAIEGPSIAARRAALQALEDVDSPETIELLSSIIRDESQRHTLRNTALDSLAKYGSAQAKAELLAIANDGVAEARVRSSIVGKLTKLEKDDVVELLANIAANDPSYATRVAAIDGLAHHEAAEHADLIAQLADFPSQHDQVRQAALRALAKLDDARGLELAMKYAAYGNVDRGRPTAIETIGKLAEHDQDTAVAYLLELLNDPERRSVRAAAAALADIGDERAIAPIRAMAESHPNPQLRESAEEWLEKLEKAQQESNTESETTAP